MKIIDVAINGFRSHVSTKIAGLGKLVLVLGPNGSGKSGLLDAIAYAFTGACRGTDEAGRGYESLLSPTKDGKPGSGLLFVKTDKATITRMVGQGPKSNSQENIFTTLGLKRQALRCALRSQVFLDMDPKEQEALMRALIATDVTPDQAKQAMGCEFDGVNVNHLTTIEGVLNAYQHCFSARTVLKKQLEGAGKLPAAPEEVEWGGEKASAADHDALAAHIESAEAVLDGMNKARSHAQKTQWLVGEKKG